MAGTFKRSLVWLGLVEPEDEDELADAVEAASRSPAGSAAIRRVRDDEGYGRRREGRLEEPAEAVIHPIPSAATGKVHLIEPSGFNDAEEIGEKFKADIPVIVNLQDMDPEGAKRLIDFAAGLIFGLDGRIQRVADKVFLLTPRNVEVSAEERRRLQERGFFNQA
ncbi:MAG TPA: cell division protein SepF [Actinomycetes bacterium]|nr:cell division protein SepF [Actinomycetes bacterium]